MSQHLGLSTNRDRETYVGPVLEVVFAEGVLRLVRWSRVPHNKEGSMQSEVPADRLLEVQRLGGVELTCSRCCRQLL